MERFLAAQCSLHMTGRHVYRVEVPSVFYTGQQTHRLLLGTGRGTLSIQGYCPYNGGFTLIDSGCLEPKPQPYQEPEPEPEPTSYYYVEEID